MSWKWSEKILRGLGISSVGGDWGSGHFILVDLDPARLGNYYYTYEYNFSEGRDTPVIATSFFDLLNRMWNSRGKSFNDFYPEFRSLGDFFELF